MKYCCNCGHPMEDNLRFCTECGTKAENLAHPVQDMPKQVPTHTTCYTQPICQPAKKHGKARPGMIVCMIICFISAIMWGLSAAIAEPDVWFIAAFYGILGVMFLLLSVTPKDSTYMFGDYTSLKKSIFITICLVGAFIVVLGGITIIAMTPNTITEPNENQSVDYSTDNTDTVIDEAIMDIDAEPENITMADVQTWYENQIPAVGQALSDYAQSVDGLTVLNVTSSKFRFGEDSGWYDCHYTFYFTCQVNGVIYDGEARAFMKYNDNTVNWFHFEIFSNDSLVSLVEHYDDSYDQIIEDYYKELESKYN